MSLVAELKRRRVFRAVVGYGIVAFALLQVVEPIMHGVHLPDATLSVVVVALGLGFPVVVVLAWAFDVSASGIAWHATDPAGAHSLRNTRLTLVLVSIGLLVAAPGVTWFFLRTRLERAGTIGMSGNPGTPARTASVAILPFADMSPEKDQEYFSDGLSEEILNALAQVEGLHVCGRTSSFSFKGRNEDLRSIGDKLGVAHVLEGSLRKEGNRIRVTAQLVSTQDGYHIWSKTFDREMGSIFAVQDEIARSVVDALSMKLRKPQARERKDHQTDTAAYDEYLRGQQLSRSGAPDGGKRALAAYEKAVAIDPSYARAWAALAIALEKNAPNDLSAYVQSESRALAAAERAIALDRDLDDGYRARGWLRLAYTWDWEGAESDFQRAVALNPGHADNILYYANLHATLGRLREAVAAKKRAAELDPLNPGTWSGLAYMYLITGQLELARSAAKQYAEMAPDLEPCLLANMSLQEGKAETALEAEKRCPIFNKAWRLYIVAIARHYLGESEASQEALDALIGKFSEAFAFQIGQVYAVRGDADKAFDWLNRAVAQHDGALIWVKYDLLLNKVRADPRYKALLTRMNLPLDERTEAAR